MGTLFMTEKDFIDPQKHPVIPLDGLFILFFCKLSIVIDECVVLVDSNHLLLQSLFNNGLIKSCFSLLENIATNSFEKFAIVPAHIIY